MTDRPATTPVGIAMELAHAWEVRCKEAESLLVEARELCGMACDDEDIASRLDAYIERHNLANVPTPPGKDAKGDECAREAPVVAGACAQVADRPDELRGVKRSDSFERHARKASVFHIMYGYSLGATADETRAWRALCARYINGEIDDVPLTLNAFREYNHPKEQ